MDLRKISFIIGLCIMTISFMGCSSSSTKDTERNTPVETMQETEEIITENITEQQEETIITNTETESPTIESDNTIDEDNPLAENNILGIWRYEDELSTGEQRNLYLNVTAIDLENMTIDMEYDFQNYAYNPTIEFEPNSKSDGIQTYKLTYFDDTTIVVEFDDEDLVIGLYYLLEETEKRQGSKKGYGFMIPIIEETIWLHHE